MDEQAYQEYKKIVEFKSQVAEQDKVEQEANTRKELIKSLADDNKDRSVHARPMRNMPVTPESLQQIINNEVQDVLVVGDINAPPSIFNELNNRTYLTKVLKVEDNTDTRLIDKFIQTKMRVGKLQDNQENYERVFNNLLARANLSMRQNKGYLLQRLGLYLSNKQQYEDDDIVVTLIKGRYPRGKRP